MATHFEFGCRNRSPVGDSLREYIFFLSFTRSSIFKFAKLKCQCNIGLLSKEYIGFNVPSLVSQAQQGEVSVITSLGDPLYKLELSSLVPYSGLVSI